ncbi:hypothetical protein COP2_023434 [Malus domestica]
MPNRRSFSFNSKNRLFHWGALLNFSLGSALQVQVKDDIGAKTAELTMKISWVLDLCEGLNPQVMEAEVIEHGGIEVGCECCL